MAVPDRSLDMPTCPHCGAALEPEAPVCPACGAPAPPPAPDLYAAFVGDNYAYYARRWASMARSGKRFSFNWPAFWLSFVWLAYRKMYLYAFLYVLFIVVESAIEIFLNVPDRAGLAIALAIGVATGGYANYVYRLHADKIIAEIKAASGPQDAAAQAARRGGTSLVAGVASVLFALLALMAGLYVADPSLFAAPASNSGLELQ